MMRATEESPRMFESDLVDLFSRVPWWMVPVLFVPVTIGMFSLALMSGAAWWAVLLWGVGGFVVWTLTEYWLHRTLFHWTPKTSWGPKLHFILHGVHHDWFNDKLRLVMPPAASLGLAVFFLSLYYAIGWALSPWMDPFWVWALFGGKVLGYMNYDLTHYYLHHGRPRLAVLKKLRAHHNAHHHNPRFAERKFGVSFTIWDHVFGTY